MEFGEVRYEEFLTLSLSVPARGMTGNREHSIGVWRRKCWQQLGPRCAVYVYDMFYYGNTRHVAGTQSWSMIQYSCWNVTRHTSRDADVT